MKEWWINNDNILKDYFILADIINNFDYNEIWNERTKRNNRIYFIYIN